MWKSGIASSLSVHVDDGCVAYLNGTEIRRIGIAKKTGRVPHDAVANLIDNAIGDAVWMSSDLLRPGQNVLAIQGVNASRTSSDLTLIPVLEGELERDPERERKRLEEFRAARAGDAAGRRLAYFEGHLLQREGKHAEAVKKFKLALVSDDSLPQPYFRLAESLRADGRAPEAESVLREALKERFAGSAELWNLWLDISARDLHRKPAEILADFPLQRAVASKENAKESRPPSRYGDDVRWLLEQLRDTGAIRINCDGEEYRSPAGVTWGRDRFYTGPDPESGGDDPFTDPVAGTEDAVYQTCREFLDTLEFPRGYRLPLPAGRYQLTLHFAELDGAVHNDPKHKRDFDVIVEGRTVLEDYEIFERGFATADRHRFEVSVDDGLLDIEFVRGVHLPQVAAIEVEPVN